MATLDLRRSLNAISDVVNNRPRPLREFDQIFMKTADMLLQTDHVGRLSKYSCCPVWEHRLRW